MLWPCCLGTEMSAGEIHAYAKGQARALQPVSHSCPTSAIGFVLALCPGLNSLYMSSAAHMHEAAALSGNSARRCQWQTGHFKSLPL